MPPYGPVFSLPVPVPAVCTDQSRKDSVYGNDSRTEHATDSEDLPRCRSVPAFPATYRAAPAFMHTACRFAPCSLPSRIARVMVAFSCGLSDPRVTVYYEDGLRFLRSKQNMYDLIINDAIDPLGHNAGLFTKEFYGNCYRALKEDGIMVYQHGSPFYDEDEESCRVMHRKASHSFPVSRGYQAHIPTCSSGYWLFGFASKKYHPLDDLNVKRWKERKIKTWYYTTNLHKGAFMLPKYVEDMLEEEEK